MSYKTILVCPGDKENTRHLTHIACDLAAQSTESRVLAAHWISRVHEFSHGELIAGEWSNKFDKPTDRLVHEMSSEFCRMTAQKEFPCEWKSINAASGLHDDAVVEYARCSDLVITPSYGGSGLPAPLTSKLILNSGRPVMVVPEMAMTKLLNLDKVVIAWNASMQSSRAALESLPLLKHARSVEILWIVEPANPDNVVHYLIKEFAAALACHKINARVEKVSMAADDLHPVSHLIAAKVKDASAGLLVVGAYGATGSRLAELGSVSAELLASSPVPIVYST